MIIHGPGSPFDLFFDGDESLNSSRGLPAAIRDVYRGDWALPDTASGLYCYSNFVMSHDGRVSFNVPGHEGGGDVSDFNPHDQWLMGLLRARADAVIVGANTLRTESEHIWTSEFIYPHDADGFGELRQAESRSRTPLQVFVTRSGDISSNAAVFHDTSLSVVVVTSKDGKENLPASTLSNADVIVAGDRDVDVPTALQSLHDDFGVNTLLCEGGPRVYGAFIGSEVLDEEFLTMSPVLIGGNGDSPRPGLIEGLPLPPGSPQRARLMSVRRADDHLFLRTSLDYGD
jgi:riboflavin biosynthesis pyrimidine reductase